jgi:hypothetical protein
MVLFSSRMLSTVSVRFHTHCSLSTEGICALAGGCLRMSVDLPTLTNMPLDEATTRNLRALAEAAAREKAPENLRELILAVNSLLDVLERQVAKLKEPPTPPMN